MHAREYPHASKYRGQRCRTKGGGFPRDDTLRWSDAMCCLEARSGLQVPLLSPTANSNSLASY